MPSLPSIKILVIVVKKYAEVDIKVSGSVQFFFSPYFVLNFLSRIADIYHSWEELEYMGISPKTVIISVIYEKGDKQNYL